MSKATVAAWSGAQKRPRREPARHPLEWTSHEPGGGERRRVVRVGGFRRDGLKAGLVGVS
jgi:hypothetical protein